MYSFEGDFRRKPQQNLGGASSNRTERDALILQLQQQRQKREVSNTLSRFLRVLHTFGHNNKIYLMVHTLL